jgi:Pin2-interacting protein X1
MSVFSLLANPDKSYRRTKLAQDPNNIKWQGNTESFGHKLMSAQGWQPGDFLGAKDAKQAEHYTAGSASHIRVMIKDDNLGLGAKIGSGVGHGECTGLDAFKDLLGRLNGKDEDELEKEKKSREDLKRAIYSERKWGTTRFVKGGFLIGDKIQPLIEAEAERIRKLTDGPLGRAGESPSNSSSSSESEAETPVVKRKKNKKRQFEEQEAILEVVAVKVKKSKKKRKSVARLDGSEGTKLPIQDVKELKKMRKDWKPEMDYDVAEAEGRRRKKEKKEKKARKEEERAKSFHKEDSANAPENFDGKSDPADTTESSGSASRITTKESSNLTSAPSSGYSTPMMQGRHAVRSRNIAQKRLASMDVASLNQASPALQT